MAREGLTTGQVIAGTLATLPTIGGDVLVALLAVTIGTNLIDLVTVPPAGTRPGFAFLLASAARVILVFWISYAVQRRTVGATRAFRPGAAFARFVLLQIIITIGSVIVRAVVLRWTPHPAPLATEWATNFAAMALWALLVVRWLAWNAALAAGEPFAALPQRWRGLRGRTGPLAVAMIGLVLPVAALHLALTLVALRLNLTTASLMTLGIVDGLIQALQLALLSALGAVALRLAGPDDALGGWR